MVGDNNGHNQNYDDGRGRRRTRIGERRWQILGILLSFLAIVVSVVVWRWPNIVGDPDFRVSVSPMDGTAIQGKQAETIVTVEAVHGYDYEVKLEFSGLPPNASAEFSEPGPKMPGYESTFTVELDENVPPDDYDITVIGEGGDGKEHQCTFELSVEPSDYYTLTIACNGDGVLDPIVGQYVYPSWAEVAISAQPEEGWEFDGWEFDGWARDVNDPESATTTVTMSSDKTVTASFSKITHILTINCEGNGTLDPPVGQKEYPSWEVVAISAQPETGWEFDGWTGDVNDPESATTTVTMSSDKTVTANFYEVIHILTVQVNGQGTVSPDEGPHPYIHGTVVTLIAVPESGWEFDGWLGNVDNPDQAITTVTMDSAKIVASSFVEMLPDLVITVAPDDITGYTGGYTSVRVTVKNQGYVVAGAFLIDIYKDQISAPSPGERGEVAIWASPLSAGASRTETLTVQYGWAGSYSLWIQLDATQALDESDETNNIYGPIPVSIVFG